MSNESRRVAPEISRDAKISLGAIRNWLADRWSDLSIWQDIRAVPPLAIWSGVTCVALMLLVRRFAVPASLKLSATQLGSTATVVGILAIATRAMLARIERRSPAGWLRAAAAIWAAWPILALLAGTSRTVPPATIGYIWGIAALSAGFAWIASRELLEELLIPMVAAERVPPVPNSAATLPNVPLLSELSCESGTTQAQAEAARHEPIRLEAAGLRFRLERQCDRAGGERLQGALMAEFAAGQSLSIVHVAFQPPFVRAPHVACEVVDASAARVKVMTVYAYGVRLELKRSGVKTSAQRVEIRFRATLSIPASRAA